MTMKVTPMNSVMIPEMVAIYEVLIESGFEIAKVTPHITKAKPTTITGTATKKIIRTWDKFLSKYASSFTRCWRSSRRETSAKALLIKPEMMRGRLRA